MRPKNLPKDKKWVRMTREVWKGPERPYLEALIPDELLPVDDGAKHPSPEDMLEIRRALSLPGGALLPKELKGVSIWKWTKLKKKLQLATP